MVGSRLLLVPVIAAVGYEILKFGARHRSNPLVKVLMYPGILVQMITTKQPTVDMIEVAIVSMEEALRADGEQLPSSSGLPREALPDPSVVRARREAERAAAESNPTAGAVPEAEAAAPVTIDPPLPG